MGKNYLDLFQITKVLEIFIFAKRLLMNLCFIINPDEKNSFLP